MCSEEGRKGLLPPLVCICTELHRLCTAPSVVRSGGAWTHQCRPVDGEAESLSLSLSEVSSLLGTEGSQLLFKSQPSATPPCFTPPLSSNTLLLQPFQQLQAAHVRMDFFELHTYIKFGCHHTRIIFSSRFHKQWEVECFFLLCLSFCVEKSNLKLIFIEL